MTRKICIAVAAILSFASTLTAGPSRAPQAQVDAANAEPQDQQATRSFEQLRLRLVIGETVYIVDDSGREVRGRIDALSNAALTATSREQRREFAVDDIRRIERRRQDPVRNGVLIGAGAGALLGFAFGRRVDSPGYPRPGVECGQGAMIGTVGGAF